MRLNEWAEEDMEKGNELVAKCLEKLIDGKPINMIPDLLPELKSLKNKSYTCLREPLDPLVAEQDPTANLNSLLASNFYHNVVVQLDPQPNRKMFEYAFGLAKDKGSKITFGKFKELIQSGKLQVVLNQSPVNYSKSFYKEIFKVCEKQGYFPPYSAYRIDALMYSLKLGSLAQIKGISPKKGLRAAVLKTSPEYDLVECQKEIAKLFDERNLEQIRKIMVRSDTKSVLKFASTRLWALRAYGFEHIADLALHCINVGKVFGFKVLHSYDLYLIAPLRASLQGFSNYTLDDIRKMFFLRVIPEEFATIWDELLESSPGSSSIAGPQLLMNTVELSGDELLSFIDRHPEEELKQNVVGVNEALSRFDPLMAMKRFSKVDEIITERVNKEIQSLRGKRKISSWMLRLGRSLVASTMAGLSGLTGFMMSVGQFQWLPAILLSIGIGKQIEGKLKRTKPEDLMKWWSRTWPFEDPGLPFILWQHEIGDAREKSMRHNQRHRANDKHRINR